MIGKYKVEREVFFKTINGLAFGQYAYTLKQFDSKGNCLSETEQNFFAILAPNYGGKHINRI